MKATFPNIMGASAVLWCAIACVAAATSEEVAKEQILATGREWQEQYDRYQPEAEMVDALRAKLAAGGVRIDVYLGLWCPDSRNHVPPFMKIMDRLGPMVVARYFSVARKAGRDVKYYMEELQVERVPTFVVYRGKGEIGRIIENPKVGMLEDLMEIVFKE